MPKAKLTSAKKIEQAVRERSVLASINSPFCVGLRAAYQDKNNLYLVLEVSL